MVYIEDESTKLHRTNMIRVELARSEARAKERSKDALGLYSTGLHSYQARMRPLDRTRLYQDPAVQDWDSLAGTRRSLPTNVPDGGPRINNNTLKFKRDTDFVSTLPYDGGGKYCEEVCLNNYVEERRDKQFKSGFHPRELRRNDRCATEYTTRYRPSDPEYVERIKDTYNNTSRFVGLHRIGPSGIAAPVVPSKAWQASGDHLAYARDGYGATPYQDHTIASKKGNFWVGTAPHSYETVTTTTMRAEPLEFQRRCASEDARSSILMKNKPLIYESDRTLTIRSDMHATNPWCRTWKSTSHADHVDFSRRPATTG
ncbi:hypothetical protein HYH03_012198 [Edaphochlamys debaryana]|uniref:Uncharacterized protein n=1 Tax=Edaphochlamys debaryana TaxID=47281 RepID=A0A835XUQ9_9CHLO|nr:hypothetical protein HYH03_012198 [Edaphochlamys debaryana]|eukprot:KAG2489368.1 hypothetical protein HYH03_012198 [Edaphochlamys debaryana]